MTSSLPLLTTLIFSPAIGIILALVFRDTGNDKNSKIAALLSSVITFVLSVYLLLQFNAQHEGLQFVERLSWIENWNIEYHLGVDGFNVFFMVAIGFMTPLALLGSWNVDKKNWQFQIQMLLLQMGMLGCFVAVDVVLFYVFFEVMLIPMYFLIGIWGSANRLYASLKFFIYTMFGSLLMLAAIIYTGILYEAEFGRWSFNIFEWYNLDIAYNEQLWLFAGFAVAFGIKIPLFPFHTWLPDAHYEAPTAGSVQLAAILLKLGPYGFIRFAIPVFTKAAFAFIPLICVLALIGIIYAGFVAMVQGKIKKLIAYSSVAHMGYIVLGVFVMNEQGMGGAMIQMINHAIVTGALFLSVGMIYERTHTQEISEYGGVINTMPIFAIFLLLFSVASIGLPGLNGFVGEVLVMLGAAKYNIYYAIVAAFGVIVAAIYMLWMYQRVMFGEVTNKMVANLKDLNAREIFILVPLAVLTIGLGVYPKPFFDNINTTVASYLKQIDAESLYVDKSAVSPEKSVIRSVEVDKSKVTYSLSKN